MQEHLKCCKRIIFCSLTALVSLAVAVPACASDVIIDGLHCNDLCQAWLGYKKDHDLTAPTRRIEHRQAVHRDEASASASAVKHHYPKIDTAKKEHVDPTNDHPALKAGSKVVAARHAQPEMQRSRSSEPSPIPKPVEPDDRPSVAVGAPILRKLRLPEPTHGPVAATAERDKSVLPTISSPIHQGPAMANMPKADEKPQQNSILTATRAAPLPAAPPPPPMLHASPFDPMMNVAKPTTDAGEIKATPPTLETADKPTSPLSALKTTAPPSPSITALLPSPVESGSSLRNDDHASGDSRKISLPLMPMSGEISPRITVGRITTEPRGTDVHVVVVNVLQQEIKDIDIRCTARDAQGLRVAVASTQIASIAPSDVGFGQAFFPSEIMPQSNTFSCETSRVANTIKSTP